MKKALLPILALCASCLLPAGAQAQQERQRGNFDPAQFQQMIMDRIREQMDVKDDEEWKAISAKIQKVNDARREMGAAGMGGMGMMMGAGRRGGAGGAGGGADAGAGGQRRNNFFGEPSPEVQGLQRAVESKASAAETKAALDKYRAWHKEKQANLEKAQVDLKKILSVQQEAVALMMGLVN